MEFCFMLYIYGYSKLFLFHDAQKEKQGSCLAKTNTRVFLNKDNILCYTNNKVSLLINIYLMCNVQGYLVYPQILSL